MCIWSIACRRCSNYIFILYLTPSFNELGKDNCKTRREIFNRWVWCLLYKKFDGKHILHHFLTLNCHKLLNFTHKEDKIPPISHRQYHGQGWHGDARNQSISRHGIDLFPFTCILPQKGYRSHPYLVFPLVRLLIEMHLLPARGLFY